MTTAQDQTAVFLGLGSNLGDRFSCMNRAVEKLSKITDVRVRRMSSLYETEPWGKPDQPRFLNRVVETDAGLEPEDLWEACRGIEAALGRVRQDPWGPRTMDIDILVFGDRVVQSERLKIPHPFLALRRFVLVPFSEIAPDFVVPGLGKPIQVLLEECPDSGLVKRISE
jgi:2-amino-4-hydroxy-6-hydroxymethyldihydropteridine diphosphokinase